MKVILLKDAAKIGRRYDIKEVSSGHALNLLIPQGLAVAATPDLIKKYSAMKAKAEAEGKLSHELEVENLKQLDGQTLTIKGKANDKGHLFAGLHKDEIVAEIAKQTKLQILPEAIELKAAIKEVGKHTITVKGAKEVKFTLDIVAL